MRYLQKLFAAACLAALTLTTQAVGSRSEEVWTAAPDTMLAGMRGGFATPSGLTVSFGIVRTVQVDGQVVSHTSFQVSDLANLTPQQAKDLAQATSLVVVQNGTGNTATGLATQGVPGLIIQNTESNTKIQATTVIDAATNSLGLLRGLSFNQMLNDALKSSMGN